MLTSFIDNNVEESQLDSGEPTNTKQHTVVELNATPKHITDPDESYLKYSTAVIQGVKESPIFMIRHLSVAFKALGTPWLLSHSPLQLLLYSALKSPSDYLVSFADASLSSVFLCVNANSSKYPEQVGLYFRKGLLYNMVLSTAVGLLSIAVPYALRFAKVPDDVYASAKELQYLIGVNSASHVTYTYLIHFMNSIDINCFNIFIQMSNCVLELGMTWLLLDKFPGYQAFLLASGISAVATSVAILLYLGLKKELAKFGLFNIFYKEFNNFYLRDLVKIGLPRGVSSLVTKAGSLGLSVVMSQNKDALKAMITPEQFRKIFEAFSRSCHNSFTKLTGIEYGKSNMKNALTYSRVGQIVLPGLLCVALVIYLLFGKSLIASSTTAQFDQDHHVSSLAYCLLIMRGVLDIVDFTHAGSEIWFAASKYTLPSMVTAIMASVLTCLSVFAFRANQASAVALYACQFIGAVPTALLLFLWGSNDQQKILQHGPRHVVRTYFPQIKSDYATKDVLEVEQPILLDNQSRPTTRLGYGGCDYVGV